MVVSDNAKNRIVNLITADISSGEHGTDGTAPTVSDTDLGTGVVATNSTVAIIELNKAFSVEHVMLSTIGNGTTYKEYGVFMNTNSVLFDRVVYPDFAKTDNLELHTITLYNIE